MQLYSPGGSIILSIGLRFLVVSCLCHEM